MPVVMLCPSLSIVSVLLLGMGALRAVADTLPDPSADGWASEAFAENAGNALSQLAGDLRKNDLKAYASIPAKTTPPVACAKGTSSS